MDLEDNIKELKKEDGFQLFNEIFHISSATGTMKIPSTFSEKVRIYFGNRDENGEITESKGEVIERIKTQKVVKVYNKLSGEGSLFNSLRASRPGMRKDEISNERQKIDEYVKKSMDNCDFCEPEKYTPEDVFGRIKGKHCITGVNIAKYDAWSSVIFFKNHNPLDFNLDELSDYIDTGFNWFKKVYKHDKNFKYPFFLWNCLQKAGASQVHGHAQVLMTDKIHYAKPQFSRKIFHDYAQKKGRNYFKDIYNVHKFLGLALDGDVEGFANLTPIKEKEFVIMTRNDPSKDQNVKEAIYRVLRCYINELGVNSFNLTISCPAFGESTIPYIIKIVDRGSIFKPTSDMGAMELYGSSVIADDPFKIIESIKNYNIK